MKKIITISREFGSGGRELARRLSEELTIAYYDREIITEIAKQTELSESYVQQIVETDSVISFPIHVARSFYVLPDPLEEQNREIFAAQHRIIKEMAEKSDCVIVGRCSDFILKEYRPFRIFVYADMESKIQRCKERTSETDLSDSALKKEILKIDKNRAWYYKFYTRQIWGIVLITISV
ncbi:AAA family ATPase [Treponema phagedenis]|uniref:cytidylate kinase-like family protein n=1 Tax=Treponema phagedenis TaxID=162 RepID=UPI001C071EA3|nr:cytidylate kinase-like family protein [Treponema phagedenis]